MRAGKLVMYNEIVPKHLQDELIQIGEDISRHTFRIGDIALSIADYVTANNMQCTKRDIWRAIGSFVGKSASSIQSYEALAQFYPPEVRRQYEVLSSSHFREAMKIDSSTDYNWRSVLDYAMDRIEVYGRPATVDELRKVFIFNSEEYEVEEAPIDSVFRNPVDEFIRALSDIKRLAELLPIPEQSRSELMDVISKVELEISSIFVEYG